MWGWARYRDPQSEHERAMQQRWQLYSVLDSVRAVAAVTAIVNGDARGADRVSTRWAEDRGISVVKYPADWKKLGRCAGPLRNQQMVDEEQIDLCVAFPGGIGTSDMVGRALDADIRVLDMNNETLPIKTEDASSVRETHQTDERNQAR